MQTSPRDPDRITDSFDDVVLTDDALLQRIFHLRCFRSTGIHKQRGSKTHVHEFLPLALEQALDRYARRFRHNTSNVRARNAIVQHRKRALHVVRALTLAFRRELPLELGNRGIAQARRALEITLALSNLELTLRVLEAFLGVLDALEARTFCLPHARELRCLRPARFEARLDLCAALGGEDVGLGAERLALDLQRDDFAVECFECVRLGLLR